ncbi:MULTISPECIES: hypothetical protein [unclassified Streptomyces]|uniref:hypothetical protein n=1 Tax=unclassified Streptomyces TaxID=2593676 RepID=UPI001F23CA5D|nr:hypothetical protein [Streptomyces sp. CB01373]
MGTEERNDAEIEAEHRAVFLAAIREYVGQGHELIARPEQTPDALRAALAVVAPGRLDEMQATKDDAFAKAVEWQSLSPVRSWVLTWARDIEIARRPDLSSRFTHAQNRLEHEDPATAREALRELSAVLDEAVKAVRG